MLASLILILRMDLAKSNAQATVPEEVRKAQALMQAKDYDGVIKILDDFTQKNPTRWGALNILGRAFLLKGDLDKALEVFQKLTASQQLRPQAQYNIAVVYALKQDNEAALKQLQLLRGTGSFDMDQILTDDNFKSLRADERFGKLIPRPEEFANPFVEKVKIIREWVGDAKGAQFGWVARRIGDVDGDKVSDFTTSAPTYSIGGQAAGRVYVYSSKSGKLIWMQSGQGAARLGTGIELAGDVNGDRIPDVIAGALGEGHVYVFSGKDGKVLLTLGEGHQQERYGSGAVSAAGDVNRDGYDDVIVGAAGNNSAGNGAGRAWVYSGKDGSVLMTLDGEKAGDAFGSAVAGYKSKSNSLLVIGAAGGGPRRTGRVYVYEAPNTKPKFTFDSDETGSAFGANFVSVVGDVNRDRTPDFYVSDWPNNAKGNSTGRFYIYSGVDGKLLQSQTGETAGDGFGLGSADAGDLNRDGHDDIIVGAWRHSGGASTAGKVYIFSGKDGSLLDSITCRIPGDTFGFDTTNLGDVDGDGHADLLLTSAWSGINGYRSGRIFIVSGKLGKESSGSKRTGSSNSRTQ